jgi:hypothetical protein
VNFYNQQNAELIRFFIDDELAISPGEVGFLRAKNLLTQLNCAHHGGILSLAEFAGKKSQVIFNAATYRLEMHDIAFDMVEEKRIQKIYEDLRVGEVFRDDLSDFSLEPAALSASHRQLPPPTPLRAPDASEGRAGAGSSSAGAEPFPALDFVRAPSTVTTAPRTPENLAAPFSPILSPSPR